MDEPLNDTWRATAPGRRPFGGVAKLRLLHAAADATGGTGALADRLGVFHPLLVKYMSGALPVPDPILFKAVDFILAMQDARLEASPPFGGFDEPGAQNEL